MYMCSISIVFFPQLLISINFCANFIVRSFEGREGGVGGL